MHKVICKEETHHSKNTCNWEIFRCIQRDFQVAILAAFQFEPIVARERLSRYPVSECTEEESSEVVAYQRLK